MAETVESKDELLVANVPQDKGALVCIQYPGFVDNVDRALSSLGGMQGIIKACHEKNHSLEVRFRPEDQYCRPAQARSVPVTNMVLRVRRRRCKTNGGPPEEMSGDGLRESECSVEVLGLVKRNFEFPGMADYQVLPPGLNQISHKAVDVDPNIFQINEPFDDSLMSGKVPLFLPPTTFSKFDKPSNYGVRPDFQPKVTANQVAGNSRQRRQGFAICIPFDHKGPIPSQPHPDAPASSQPKLQALRELFDERPIWSRSGVQCRINLPDVIVRNLLALVSYYFTSGPWKMLWVRLGYDPRSSPANKPYQCLDYRIPRDIAIIDTLKTRRKQHKTAPLQVQKRVFQLTGDQESVRLAEARAESQTTDPENSAVFTADQLPSQRQLYYQLCDLREDSLQAVIHANDGRETECTVRSVLILKANNIGSLEANGWCEDGAYDKLRKMLGDMIRKTAERIQAEHQLPQQNTVASTSHSTY